MNIRAGLACLWLACCVVGVWAKPPMIDGGQIVVFWSCAAGCDGDTATNPNNPMCLSYGLQEPGGWPHHMQTKIYKDYLDGYRRFLLHLPFGSEPGNGAMDLDQPVDNMEAGLGYIAIDFYEALAWAEIYMPDAEFIIYLGTAEADLNAALTNDNRYYDHWYRMSGGSWNMVLLAYPNTSIVFDYGTNYTSGSTDWGVGDPYFHFLKLMECYKVRQGRRVYIEAVPVNEKVVRGVDAAKYEWQRTMPWVALEGTYLAQIQRWVNHVPPLASPEAIRIMVREQDKQAWDSRGGVWAWAADVVRCGHTPAIGRGSPSRFPWSNLTAEQLAAIMNIAAGNP